MDDATDAPDGSDAAVVRDPAETADGTAHTDAHWQHAFADLIDRGHRCTGDELPKEINGAVRRLGLTVVIHLVDHHQTILREFASTEPSAAAPLPVDHGPAGQAFTTVSAVPDGDRLWIAMVNGAERLGVIEIRPDRGRAQPADLLRRCTVLAGLVGHLVSAKQPYGDSLPVARRTRPMTPAAELLRHLLPPLTFSSKKLVVSAVLEPAYECGGDAFDYAVDGSTARFAVLDAMGRGLRAGLTAAVALSAMRAARRDGRDLDAMTTAADAAITEQFIDLRFVTGVIADLDLDTGELRYLNAGHPEPLLLRDGKVLSTLTGGRRLPLGLTGQAFRSGQCPLEPDDRLLLYTDGVVEAPAPDGQPFGLDRLIELAQQTAFAGLPAPETLRLLADAVFNHQAGQHRDDATLMLVEWSTAATHRIMP